MSAKVHELLVRVKRLEAPIPPIDGGGGGGDDGGMTLLEQRISAIETLIPTLATKPDLAPLATKADLSGFRADVADIRTDIHKAITENSRWTYTATIGMFTAFVLGVTGLLFTMYNASKQAPPRAEPTAIAPIVIQIPNQATVSAPEKAKR
jgi:hypothetical protein